MLAWLGELGYEVLHGRKSSPESLAGAGRLHRSRPPGRLRAALERINPDLPDGGDRRGAEGPCAVEPASLENNRRFHRLLVDGVDVEYRLDGGGIARRRRRLVDFDDPTQRLAGGQPVHGHRGQGTTAGPTSSCSSTACRSAVIELKNPADENATIDGAFNQLQTYKDEIPSLFAYNELLVVSDGIEARVGTLTADWERFMPVADRSTATTSPPTGAPELEVLVRGVFEPSALPRPGPQLRRLRGRRAAGLSRRSPATTSTTPSTRPSRHRRRRRGPTATAASAWSGTRRAPARA